MAVCLITGSEGTLGRKLRTELTSRGHSVWGCDLHHNDKTTHTRADVAIARQLQRVYDKVKPDVTFHLAAEFGRDNSSDYAEQVWITNCVGTRNVIDCCIEHKSWLVFASSSEVYGDIADQGTLYEDALTRFVPRYHNEYALSKRTNELQLDIAIRHRGLQATILRFFNAYSEEFYSPYRSVVCAFIYKLMKNEPITVYEGYHRVFMHSTDWAHTVANAAERWEKGWLLNGDIINIGGVEYVSITELVEKLLVLLGGSQSVITYLPKEKANITNKKPSLAHAQCALGHNPTITLDEGLPGTVAWMKATYNA